MRVLAMILCWVAVLGERECACAQVPADSPRRTRNVEIIERLGAGVVAVFSRAKDNSIGSGSGSVLHPDGYILTNDHVVQDRPGIILYQDLPPIEFRTVGRLPERDLAILKVDAPRPFVTIPLGRSHDLLAGEPILVGGNPGGRGIVFSAGIVSSPKVILGAPSALVMANFPDDSRDRFLQFDAASNPGNSGGPVINAEGQQVGVVVAKSPQEQAINFAIPVDRVLQNLGELMLPEMRGNFWVGIELQLDATTIRRVAEGSPAALAGLQVGDELLSVGGRSVAGPFEYLASLVGRDAGDKVGIRFRRDEKTHQAQMKLVPYPEKPSRDVASEQPGLRYQLYRGRFVKCADLRRHEPVETGVATGFRLADVPNLPSDEFGVVLEGYLEIPASGVWTLAIGSDDGSRLYLDDELVADNDGPHPLQFASGHVRCQKGWHKLRIEYFELTGEAGLDLVLARDGTTTPEKFQVVHDAGNRGK
ncbi:MAG: trypsin-like peptidase domain-containing protein [Planctomycetes bacterium]|nr:trypsin-like peptidase domain-containing protein [Planctomycetota bacterium]